MAGPLFSFWRDFFFYRYSTFFIDEVLFIDEVAASIALAILLQKLDDEFGILSYVLLISIVSVDENHQVSGVAIHLGSLIVAGWSSHATYLVTVNRQTFDVDHASADTLVWFASLAHTQSQGVSLKLIGIKTADAVAVGDACQVHQVHQRISLIKFLALQHSSDEGF